MEEHLEYGALKVIELVGISKASFDDAVSQAVARASRTLSGIKGIEVNKMTAKVDQGKITEFHVALRLAFVIEDKGG